MTKSRSALLALSAVLLIGCSKTESAEPRALTAAAPADQAQRVPAAPSTPPLAQNNTPPATNAAGQVDVNAQGAATL